eukprot:CAMPEP_0172660622 /NCGR_PEP_ID=MMETSP1074-20121228/4167_1 /TAXON_ID=2916 /ORGANISM="Ceratium fusus, Strain PA161109" /LENGTH=133 /DNA_ID=CAMNT_0013476257 /DNA_START=74 /DNA_END=475 /DNA_ORIENTATION=-
MSKTGFVKKWFEEKGFGFIGQDNGGEDLFCHRSHLSGADALDPDAKVRFDEVWDDRKGKMHADNVSLVDGGGKNGYSDRGGYGGGKNSSKGKGYGGCSDRDYGGRDPAARGYGSGGSYKGGSYGGDRERSRSR